METGKEDEYRLDLGIVIKKDTDNCLIFRVNLLTRDDAIPAMPPYGTILVFPLKITFYFFPIF